MWIQNLWERPLLYFSVILVVMISIILHELAHGFAAIWQGDDTPRVTGHMTLDPLVHMGPVSLILLAVIGLAFGAMPVNPRNFRSRLGHAWVALAGPVMNLVLFLVFAVIADLLLAGDADGKIALVGSIFVLGSSMNLLLAILNLIPVPPLDGFTVLSEFSRGFRRVTSNPFFHQYGFFLVLAIFLSQGGKVWAFALRQVVSLIDLLPF